MVLSASIPALPCDLVFFLPIPCLLCPRCPRRWDRGQWPREGPQGWGGRGSRWRHRGGLGVGGAGASGRGRQRARGHRDWPRQPRESGPRDRGACGHKLLALRGPAKNTRARSRSRGRRGGGSRKERPLQPGGRMQLWASPRGSQGTWGEPRPGLSLPVCRMGAVYFSKKQ